MINKDARERMIMGASTETYAGKDGQTELSLEIGRILLRIHRKWQLSDQGEVDPAKETVPQEEMETVIIPACSETVQSVSPVEDELMETVILSPLKHGKFVEAATEEDEDIFETVILLSDSMREVPSAIENSSAYLETVVLSGNNKRTGQLVTNVEESIEETVVLPPRKDLLRRKGSR